MITQYLTTLTAVSLMKVKQFCQDKISHPFIFILHGKSHRNGLPEEPCICWVDYCWEPEAEPDLSCRAIGLPRLICMDRCPSLWPCRKLRSCLGKCYYLCTSNCSRATGEVCCKTSVDIEAVLCLIVMQNNYHPSCLSNSVEFTKCQ